MPIQVVGGADRVDCQVRQLDSRVQDDMRTQNCRYCAVAADDSVYFPAVAIGADSEHSGAPRACGGSSGNDSAIGVPSVMVPNHGRGVMSNSRSV